MESFVLYDPETGRIKQVISGGDPRIYKDGHWWDKSTVVKKCTGLNVDIHDRVDVYTEDIYTPISGVASLEDIKSNVNEPDSVLNATIDDYLNTIGMSLDAKSWRSLHQNILRSWAYPPIGEFVDAQIKIQSGDPGLLAEGNAQLQAYVTKCLDVKAKYQKPNTKETP